MVVVGEREKCVISELGWFSAEKKVALPHRSAHPARLASVGIPHLVWEDADHTETPLPFELTNQMTVVSFSRMYLFMLVLNTSWSAPLVTLPLLWNVVSILRFLSLIFALNAAWSLLLTFCFQHYSILSFIYWLFFVPSCLSFVMLFLTDGPALTLIGIPWKGRMQTGICFPYLSQTLWPMRWWCVVFFLSAICVLCLFLAWSRCLLYGREKCLGCWCDINVYCCHSSAWRSSSRH